MPATPLLCRCELVSSPTISSSLLLPPNYMQKEERRRLFEFIFVTMHPSKGTKTSAGPSACSPNQPKNQGVSCIFLLAWCLSDQPVRHGARSVIEILERAPLTMYDVHLDPLCPPILASIRGPRSFYTFKSQENTANLHLSNIYSQLTARQNFIQASVKGPD